MKIHKDPHHLNAVFLLIRARAKAGERAPINDEFSGGTPVIQALAERGLIRVEVFAQNWRVIEILEGPEKGCRTKECPLGGEPYLVYPVRVE